MKWHLTLKSWISTNYPIFPLLQGTVMPILSHTFTRFSFSIILTSLLFGCGGGGSTSAPFTPPPTENTATITTASGSVNNRLACEQGIAKPECNLRLYQVMVESFVDGDPAANYNTGYGTSHHKGDIQGIIDSLDYIKSTGANAIWLTPIFTSTAEMGQSASTDKLDATGYFASDYFSIDPKFGSMAKAKELVDTAHAKGLYVFFDGVFGHHKANLVASPSGNLPVDLADLTGLNRNADYTDPKTLAFYKEVAEFWVKNLKIDGWRLDQAYQVPPSSLAALRSAVQDASQTVSYTNSTGVIVKPLGHMVAEVWQDENSIASKAYGSDASPALASAFDFPARYRVVQTLAGEENSATSTKKDLPASTLAQTYLTRAVYPAHAMPNLMLGNHDLVRFGDLIQRAGLGEPNQPAYWNRHKAAFAFMASVSGPLTVYYGDEIGQEVAGFSTKVAGDCASVGLCDDHVARDSGMVEGVTLTSLTAQQADLKNTVAQLWALRDAHPALSIGTRTSIYADSNVLVDRKDAGTDRILFVINTKTLPAIIKLNTSVLSNPLQLRDLQSAEILLSNTDSQFIITVPPLSARLMQF